MHYFSPALSEQQLQRLIDQQRQATEPVVYIIVSESKCAQCNEELPKGGFLMMDGDNPCCMPCTAHKDLVFLPAGDALITRRAKKYSDQSLVMVKFSRARKMYERQGIFVTEEALAKAEAQK